MREPLPQRRESRTFHLRVWNQDWAVTVGYYDEGTERPGEVFVSGAKSGVQLDGVARDCSILLSLCLQHGVPLDVIRHALTREGDGSASTVVGAVVDLMAARDGKSHAIIETQPDGETQ